MSAPPALPRTAHRWRYLVPSLIFLSYTLMVVAWIVGNPPPAAPDEWSHYLRAVGIGHGQLLGTPGGREGAQTIVGATRPPNLSEKTYEDQLAWVGQNTRQVTIPAGLTPGWFRCGGHQHNPLISLRCLNDSPPLEQAQAWFNPTATYQPLAYLLPAAISRIKTTPDSLSRLMRTGKALISLMLVGAAIFLLWKAQSGAVSLVGVMVGLTPMAVFLSATLNPSGLEITASLAFAGALLRLTRADEEHRFAWMTLAASGAVLALSRTQGPVWIALILVLIVPLTGTQPFLSMGLRHRRWSGAALIAVSVSILLNRLWEYLYGPTLAFDPLPLSSSLRTGLAHLPYVMREQIGMFDYLEFGVPKTAAVLWGGLSAALGVMALTVGSKKERFLLVASLMAAVALPVVLVATTMRHTGFGLQGRYVLPLSIVVPLLAGEILVRRNDRVRALRADRLFLLIAIPIALFQLLAWWTNARRFAVGLGGRFWFLGSAEWSPPWGWWPWSVLAAGATGLMVAAALVDWWSMRAERVPLR